MPRDLGSLPGQRDVVAPWLDLQKGTLVDPTSSKAEHISETHGDRIQTQPNTKAALVMDLGSIYTQGSHKCRHTAETPSSSLACRERKAHTENFIGSQAPTDLEIIPVQCTAPQSTQHLCPDLKPSSGGAYSPASPAWCTLLSCTPHLQIPLALPAWTHCPPNIPAWNWGPCNLPVGPGWSLLVNTHTHPMYTRFG